MNQIVESVSSLSKAIELSTQFSPKRRAELLADRCLVEIERAQVRAKGKPQLNDPRFWQQPRMPMKLSYQRLHLGTMRREELQR